jgi:hypothetical protein
MFSLLNRLVGRTKSSTRRVARPGPARRACPTLEVLENRELLSATSSLAPHAVKDRFGYSEVFYVRQTDHSFYMRDNGRHQTWKVAGGMPSAFSAGLDSKGQADVFYTTANGSMWEWNYGNSKDLGAPESMVEFAAVKGDRVYAVGADRALWEYSPPITILGFLHRGGWQRLDGPGAVQSIDAVTDAGGGDAVFALRGDGSFQERLGGKWHYLTEPGIKRGFSAGTDSAGNADVFCIDAGNQLYRHTSTWSRLSGPNTVRTMSATDSGQVVFIDKAGKLKKYDSLGALHVLDSVSTYLEVSAASSNDVYVTIWNHSGWERTGGGVWNQWSSAGTVL